MILWWWCFLFLKMGLVSYAPQTADENYYWVWAQNLSLSYYDHPPFVAWLFKLGDFLPSYAVKWPAVLLGQLALLLWASFLKNLGFRDEQIRQWFLLSVMAPLVGLTTMVLTPDLPLLFFFSLSIYAFERALKRESLKYYLLFGLSLGLGFTSKYHIVLILPCLLLYLFTSGDWRLVRWRYLPMVILLAILGAAPVLIWNYQNDWASFRFQFNHGIGKKAWKSIWPIEYVASVLILILPFYWKTLWTASRLATQKLLLALSWPILLFFLTTSMRSKVEANWSQLAFLPLLSLLAYYDLSRWKARTALMIWSACLAVLLWIWQLPWYPGCPEKFCEPQRYQAVIEVSKLYQPFMASNYQMASYLWFQNKAPVFKLFDMSRRDYYDTFAQAKPIVPQFYLVKHEETEVPGWLSDKNYKVEMVKKVDQDLTLLRVYQ